MVMQVAVHQGSQHLTTWVPLDSRVRPGVQIELKGEHGLWMVDQVYSRLDQSLINRKWNVGGL